MTRGWLFGGSALRGDTVIRKRRWSWEEGVVVGGGSRMEGGLIKSSGEGGCRVRNCLGQGKSMEFRRGCLLMGLVQGKAVGC